MTRSRQMYLWFWRAMSPVAILCLRMFTAITKRPRVRILATNEYGEILLMKTVISPDNKWSLPGGGIERGETAQRAAQREFFEETGARVPDSLLRQIRVVQKAHSINLHFTAILFTVTVKKHDIPKYLHNPAEIEAIRWFNTDKLPKGTAPLVAIALRGPTHSSTMK